MYFYISQTRIFTGLKSEKQYLNTTTNQALKDF